MTPEQGLYTAIVAGFLISALGGSRVQIGGPTGAFVVIVYGVVAAARLRRARGRDADGGRAAGGMGFARLGVVIQFVPYPVTVGFTSGIALIIATRRCATCSACRSERVPADFVEKLARLRARTLARCAPAALAIVRRARSRSCSSGRASRAALPGPLVALVAAHRARAARSACRSRRSATASARSRDAAGAAAARRSTLAQLRALFSPALAIALLAAIESLLSAVVADGMIGRAPPLERGAGRAGRRRTSRRRSSAASPRPARSRAPRPTCAPAAARRSPGWCTRSCCSRSCSFFGRWAGWIPIADARRRSCSSSPAT